MSLRSMILSSSLPLNIFNATITLKAVFLKLFKSMRAAHEITGINGKHMGQRGEQQGPYMGVWWETHSAQIRGRTAEHQHTGDVSIRIQSPLRTNVSAICKETDRETSTGHKIVHTFITSVM